jgi:hypothetical protein
VYWKPSYQLGILTFGEIFIAMLLLALPVGIVWYGFRFNLGQRYINIATISSFPFLLLAAGWVVEASLKDEFESGANTEVIEGMVVSQQRVSINGHRGIIVELADRTIQIEQGIRAGCFSPLDFDYREGSFLKFHILWINHPSEKVKGQSPCIVKVEHWVCHEPPFEDYTYNCKMETWPQLNRVNSLPN